MKIEAGNWFGEDNKYELKVKIFFSNHRYQPLNPVIRYKLTIIIHVCVFKSYDNYFVVKNMYQTFKAITIDQDKCICGGMICISQ